MFMDWFVKDQRTKKEEKLDFEYTSKYYGYKKLIPLNVRLVSQIDSFLNDKVLDLNIKKKPAKDGGLMISSNINEVAQHKKGGKKQEVV